MIRQPAYAGQFYPASPSELKAMIESFIDKKAEKVDVIGLVAPHAGYIYSAGGRGGYFWLEFKDTFIIGPNHTGRGKPFSIMTEGTEDRWVGAIDSELAKKLVSISAHLPKISKPMNMSIRSKCSCLSSNILTGR
jgi:AmmeMemoRadiSam system protein B